MKDKIFLGLFSLITTKSTLLNLSIKTHINKLPRIEKIYRDLISIYVALCSFEIQQQSSDDLILEKVRHLIKLSYLRFGNV